MNSWFTVKVKYTKQLDDGTFKRVSEPYLLAAMTFTDAEARIYEELGSLIRGEFMVTHITRTDIHYIYHYEDANTWYKCIITYEAGGDGEEGTKSKKVSQTFLVTAHTVENASERLKESLGGMMIDYNIKSVVLSPLVDVFPFGDEEQEKVAQKFETEVKQEVTAFQEDQEREKCLSGDFVAGDSWIWLGDVPNKCVVPNDGQEVEILTVDRGVLTGMEFDQSDPDFWTFSKYLDEDHQECIEYYIGDEKVTHWRESK